MHRSNERGITEPVEVTRTALEAYQRRVFHYRKKNGEPLSFTGQHDRIVPFRVWFKWMARHHHILHNPASEWELPRLGMRLPKAVLTEMRLAVSAFFGGRRLEGVGTGLNFECLRRDRCEK